MKFLKIYLKIFKKIWGKKLFSPRTLKKNKKNRKFENFENFIKKPEILEILEILEKTLRFQYFPQEFEDFLQKIGILIFEVQKKYEIQKNIFFIFFLI